MDHYDELYVISDIHLGGEKKATENFQIFKYGERLGLFIQEVTAIRPGDKVCLVLNGDIFDSLAEQCVKGYVALSEAEALSMITRIHNDPSFKPVWDALEQFLATPKRYLVLVIGNHDIELALPVVQNFLREKLTHGNGEQQSRIVFATTGGGYSCMVGKARVFCTHGNETDDFNWVDYNTLGQLANAMNAGRTIDNEKWRPNAGTRIVVDLMNIVKKRYPFVDVLKPETSAVAAVLMTLDKKTFSKIDLKDVIPILLEKRKGKSMTWDLLGDYPDEDLEVSSQQSMETFLSHVVGKNLEEEILSDNATSDEYELLLDAEENLDEEDSEFEGTAEEQETLGWEEVVFGKLGFTSKENALRRALQDWNEKQQEEFKIDHEDLCYKDIQDRIGSEVDFVITGHTHMPRAIPMGTQRYYYNTGTWIRTLRFTKASLHSKKFFKDEIWPALKGGSLEELDNLDIPADSEDQNKKQKLLFDRTSAVRISANGNQVSGDLLRIIDGQAPRTIELETEPETEPFIC